ncbi:MAG: hypothetical protein DA330_02785 [Nitrososphaera sp.]|nr:hypothetical protein [Nitrososphaera sp.]
MSEESSRFKSAASLLLKGGSLINEACTKCGGVQVKFGGKITCINCGNETGVDLPKPSSPIVQSDLASAATAIEEKITSLAAEIKSESDIGIQKQKIELVQGYLGILERLRFLARQQ